MTRTIIHALGIVSALMLISVTMSGCKSKAGVSGGNDFTHVVTQETEYYLDGPQQARPPDGTLTAGTKVKLIESKNNYSLLDEPVKGHVFTGDLQPLE